MARDGRGRYVKGDVKPASGREPQPYEPGNLAALKHGARSPRLVEPLTAELAKEVLERRPDLERFPEALEAWADAEARVRLIRAWHARVGMIDEEKGTVRAGADLARAESAAQRMRERLGLDPRGEFELVKLRNEMLSSDDAIQAIIDQAKAPEIEQGPRIGVGPYV